MKYAVKIGYSVKGLKWIPVTFLSTIATRKKKKKMAMLHRMWDLCSLTRVRITSPIIEVQSLSRESLKIFNLCIWLDFKAHIIFQFDSVCLEFI